MKVNEPGQNSPTNLTKKQRTERIKAIDNEVLQEHVKTVKEKEDLMIANYEEDMSVLQKERSSFTELDQLRRTSESTSIDFTMELKDSTGKVIKRMKVKGGFEDNQINEIQEQIYSKMDFLNNAVCNAKAAKIRSEPLNKEAIRIIATRKIIEQQGK